MFLNWRFFNFLILGALISSAHAGIKTQKDSLPSDQTTNPLAGYYTLSPKSPLDKTGLLKPQESTYKRFKGLKYSGYVRSYMQFRDMPVRYSGAQQSFTVNGLDISGPNFTGYQEPLALIRLEAAPTARTAFKVEYMFDNQMWGTPREDTTAGQSGIQQSLNRRAMTYRIFQFTGSANTKFGDFNLTAGGGVNWYRTSPFTLWNYEFRDDMFERYPWDPDQHAWGKYMKYYGDQNIARDSRWGNTGTQGFIIEGKNMPKGFGFAYLYGKTDNSGGFQTYLAKIPKNMMAGRLKKAVGSHEFGLNFFDQFGFPNAQALQRIRQQIYSTDARLNFAKFKVFYEIGVGMFQTGVIDRKTQEFLTGKPADKDSIAPGGIDFGFKSESLFKYNQCINVQFDFSKEMFKVPLSVQFFSVGKSVVNINGQAINSSNPYAVGTPANVGTVNDITTHRGVITDIGQMTNNRQGVYLKHENAYGPIKALVALGATKEIENDSLSYNAITVQHQANAFTLSRFNYFVARSGPYSRITSIFRRTYERFLISDPDSLVTYKKMFNTLNLGLKYKMNVLGKELILSAYMNYNSVSDKSFSPIPLFDDKAFIRNQYTEFMFFYALHPKVTILGFASMETTKGNNRVEMADANGNTIVGTDSYVVPNGGGVIARPIYDPNGKTLNQVGHGFGLGLDYDFRGRAGLFLRHRWFDHKDVSFTKDRFYGQESTVELKIFF